MLFAPNLESLHSCLQRLGGAQGLVPVNRSCRTAGSGHGRRWTPSPGGVTRLAVTVCLSASPRISPDQRCQSEIVPCNCQLSVSDILIQDPLSSTLVPNSTSMTLSLVWHKTLKRSVGQNLILTSAMPLRTDLHCNSLYRFLSTRLYDDIVSTEAAILCLDPPLLHARLADALDSLR